jgi:hypothetical protein
MVSECLKGRETDEELNSPLDVDKGIRLGYPKVECALYLYNRDVLCTCENYTK